MSNLPVAASGPIPLRSLQAAGCAALVSLIAAAGSLPAAHAGTIGSSSTVRYQAGVLADICNISTTDGALAAQQNRTLITSDAAALTGPYNGSAQPARISVTSNMGSNAIIVADQPQLSGPSAATTSQLAIGNNGYGTTSSLPTGSDGSLTATLNVKFQSANFASGTYQSSAVVTCTDNGSK